MTTESNAWADGTGAGGDVPLRAVGLAPTVERFSHRGGRGFCSGDGAQQPRHGLEAVFCSPWRCFVGPVWRTIARFLVVRGFVMERVSWMFMFVLLAAVSSAAAVGQDWDRARWYYEEAMAESDLHRRIELLDRSFNEHATYEAAIDLAEARLELGLPSAGNREWLDKAFRLAAPGEARARALFRKGETYRIDGEAQQAAESMQRSLEHLQSVPDPSPDVEENIRMVERSLQEVRGDGFRAAADIVEALRRRAPGGDKGAGMGIDLWINFEFDSARLTPSGRDQAHTLGDALLDLAAYERGQGLSIVLVGHTDTQGTRAYNDRLSLRRAEAVRDYLVDGFGLDPRDVDIEVEGRGERDPISPLETDAAHALNRRVEVIRR